MINNRDTTIIKSGEDLDAAREELRAQALILQGKEEQIQNENEQHRKAIELNVQQHKQATFQIVSTITKEFEDKHRDTEKRLQEAVTARAELEHELAELRQQVDNSSQVDIDEGLNKIRGELVELITSMNGLTRGLQESEIEREALQTSLDKWSHDRNEVGQMRNLLGRLAKDQPNAIKMSEQLRELLEIQKKLSGTLEYHQAGLANAGIAVGSSESQRTGETFIHSVNDSTVVSGLQNGVVNAQEELQNLKRKVVVKSPANDNDLASPMSVEEERSTRRHLQPVRGIMKIATRGPSTEQEVEGNAPTVDSQRPMAPQPANRRIAKRGSKSLLTTHSLYNRPVAGSISGVSTRQVGASQSDYKGSRDDDTDNITPGADDSGEIVEVGGNIDEPPLKRQRINGTLVAQKVKVSHSMSTQFSAKSDNSKPAEEISSRPKTPSLRGRPLERRPSGLLTYGSQGVGMKRPQSKPSDASNAMNSTDSQSTIASSQTMKSSDSQG
ncbi:uncharacterized protein F4807DRAFT_431578 [Annulohypoxylon truncatum]|uniref:uncharacterized protein n=1 Tax=Annulohypoxylon truncatum TaxID=327061 RepID=UPI0020083CAA|nr:uncharacterized protein F4807DRAFT_431578 [Annulohypoxylon truncatum]KAI1208108.1 hypothetical protein F4807DRAFT_431578 [Annulohypoxylon truncatum]